MDRAETPDDAVVHVVVVDDEPMVCEFLRTILSSTGQVVVDTVACDGAAGTEAAVRHRPDVVLMDLRMPGVDGVTATAEIRALPHPPAVVAMTTFDTDEHVLAALDAGASGFLLQDHAALPADPVRPGGRGGRVGAVARGGTAPARTSLRRGRPRAGPEIDALPPREREVLALLGEGRSNAGIAARLYLSEGTVKGHVSRLMAILGCQNRTQLALRAARRGGQP